MKNLLKGMLIGFIIGGILLTAAAFLFFRHPTEEPEPEVPAAEVSKAVQEEAPESGISLPEEPETPEIPAVEPTREASEEVSEPEEPDSALLAFAGDVMFSDPFLAPQTERKFFINDKEIRILHASKHLTVSDSRNTGFIIGG